MHNYPRHDSVLSFCTSIHTEKNIFKVHLDFMAVSYAAGALSDTVEALCYLICTSDPT